MVNPATFTNNIQQTANNSLSRENSNKAISQEDSDDKTVNATDRNQLTQSENNTLKEDLTLSESSSRSNNQESSTQPEFSGRGSLLDLSV